MTEVCVAFPALSAIEEGFDVFVVTDASGTFNDIARHSAWDRMSQAGAQLINWFGVACELHRDWRNDVEGHAAVQPHSRLPQPDHQLQRAEGLKPEGMRAGRPDG